MIARQRAADSLPHFTPREREVLRALRLRYREDHDHFSPRERARLRFLRWLRETGRI
jgi:hypothetical protein